MEPPKGLPTISIVVPTYNSERVLRECLQSIECQNYPKEKIELIIADAGSTDKTLGIAREYTNNIVANPLKTGEAGKAIGVKNTKNEIVAFIDSDNVLPATDWLMTMIEPFSDESIVGVEPISYTHRRQDNHITRYCALLGMNDPICLFLGNYDRYSFISGKWTGMDVKQEDKGTYIRIELVEKNLPTIGANGFMIRRDELDKIEVGNYLFDIDMIFHLIRNGSNRFAKVKIGIVHLFSGSMSTFIRKQRRRIKDYTYYKQKGLREYPWSTFNKLGLLRFVTYTLLTIPLMMQVVRGYLRKHDIAWLLHIPACWFTLLIYGSHALEGFLREPTLEDRQNWSQ